jgi:hypothetical protein
VGIEDSQDSLGGGSKQSNVGGLKEGHGGLEDPMGVWLLQHLQYGHGLRGVGSERSTRRSGKNASSMSTDVVQDAGY